MLPRPRAWRAHGASKENVFNVALRPSAPTVIIALAVAHPHPLPRLPPLFEELLKKNRRKSILRKLNFLRQQDDVGGGEQWLELRGRSVPRGRGVGAACGVGGSALC